jgi:hypothetical protein
VPALQLDTIFDDILTSALCLALKGDLVDGESPFFGPWLSEHGIKPSEVVLVDDCPVPAAEAIGMIVRLVEHLSRLADVRAQFEVAGPSRKGLDVI